VTPTDVDAFMSQPVDMDQFHEARWSFWTIAGRCNGRMPRHTYGPGVRQRLQPKPVKVKKSK
jgi:hypothetical protein